MGNRLTREHNLKEEQLQSSLTGKRYDQMKKFMVNIWRSEAKYKIFMARRVFNLNYAFMEACDAKKDNTFITDNIMSNTALLLCAEEIARYYRRGRKFPRILIVDDLLFHGRGIIKLLNDFETLIVGFLEGENIKGDRAVVHESLFSAVNIYVFAQNKEGLLVDCRYALKSELRLPMNILRGLSQQISSALQNCGVANTSYVLSVALPLYDSRILNYGGNVVEPSYLFRYRGYSQLYYYKYNNKLLKTIRTNIPVNSRRLDRMFTSLVIWDDILFSEFDGLCDSVAAQLETVIPYSRIVEILRYQNKRLARPKAQMLSFLLSIECFADFYREKISIDNSRLYHIFLKSDYWKIVTNFDKEKLLRYEILKLFKHICFEATDKYLISDMVSDHVQNMGEMDEENASSCFRIGRAKNAEENTLLFERAEDIFYEKGIEAESDAANYIHGQKKFEPASSESGMIRLNEYLNSMGGGTDGVKSIGCLFELMDSGLLSMNIERGQNSIQCVLKSGELAMYVIPRRFSTFIPALAIVEEGAQKRNIDLKIAIGRFIDYLQNYCYKQNGYSSKGDSDLLQRLGKSKKELLCMYASKQFFQDWNTELLTKGDRIGMIEEQFGRYVPSRYQTELRDEAVRKRHYAYCARLFIHSNDW